MQQNFWYTASARYDYTHGTCDETLDTGENKCETVRPRVLPDETHLAEVICYDASSLARALFVARLGERYFSSNPPAVSP